jgi:WD40 repeat protein
MRLLPLDHDGIVEAVVGPCRSSRLLAKYRLKVDNRLPETIAGHLGGDPDSPIAPTLQILLTRMWELTQEENPDEPRFTEQLYESLRRKGDLLRNFLNEQFEHLGEWRPVVIESGLALDVLAFHTTTVGAARQQTWENLQEEYCHLNVKSELRPLIQKCKERYLLVDPAQNQRGAAETTRLSHDTLAPLIRERYELSTKPGQVARRVLESLVVDWEDDKIGTHLGEGALKVVKDGKGGMRARRDDEERLVKESEEAQAVKRRLRRTRWVVGLVAALLILLVAGIAGWQRLVLSEIRQAKQRADALALVLRGQWAFEDDPLLGVRLLLEGWKLTAQEERPSVEAAIRDQMQYGRLKALGQGDVAGIYYLADDSIFIVDREKAPGELYHTTDGSVKLLPGEISLVKYSPDPGATFVVVGYEDAPGELRRTADNALVAPLSGEISAIEFSPDPDATYFVVDYEGKPGELRKTSDASLIAPLTDEVSRVQFSPDLAATYLIVSYKDRRGELRKTSDGSLIAPLTDGVSKVQFSPDPAVQYLAVLYGVLGEHSGEGDLGDYYDNDPPAELRRSDDGSLITTLEHQWFLSISSLTFRPRQTATYLEVEFVDVSPAGTDFDYGFPVDPYVETERELRRTTDGALISSSGDILDGIPETTTYQPDPPANYSVLQLPRGPAELHIADGSVVSLTDTIREVSFSPAGAHFVAHYNYDFPELRRSDGSLVAVLDLGSLRMRIVWLAFSPDGTLFVFQACGSPGCSAIDLRRTTDGALVGQLDLPLGPDLSRMAFGPDASYLMAYFSDGGVEAFFLPEAEQQSWGESRIAPEPVPLPSEARINNIAFSPNGSFSVVYLADGGSELWEWSDPLRVLTDMGLGLSEHRFGPNHQRLIVWHTDGRAYMLDLDWLRAIGGGLASYSVDELEQIFCCGPLAAGRFEEAALESKLLDNPSQACQFELPCDELLVEH